MHSKQKHFVRILLFFYLFSAFVSASHIHHDDTAHDEGCDVCIVVKNLHSGDITPSFTLDKIVTNYSTVIALVEQHYTQYTNLKYIHSQAPPLFS